MQDESLYRVRAASAVKSLRQSHDRSRATVELLRLVFSVYRAHVEVTAMIDVSSD